MAPVRAGFCPLLLLLLLGLWVAEIPVSAKPKHMTPSQWFKAQHVQPKSEACGKAMASINKDGKRCKNLNTFLHDSFSNVANTCQTPTIACKNKRKNCHQSHGPVSMTLCQLTSGKYPNCKYKEKHQNSAYIVACEPRKKGDSKEFHLVPVHLDKVI
ncbi:PREDICTED: ribonuclease 7-like [Galeopterus variegatus]|uniref:Ribonuclease 7 n=1 Tax=Galeopterus variegatus TaxID=482537 RepID=A0ABM0RNZ0_GALVR|nr:PREDICTED: ribonuclease 7 [Galeopterus variegatus]XP_008582332.1 PREDICTED: ribonuclease 7-like [Galeopterus variegatus]